LSALARAPRRTLLFAASLLAAWPGMRLERRRELGHLLDIAASVPFPEGLSAPGLAAIGRLYAAALEPGAPPPRHVLAALDRHSDPRAGVAAVAIHAALATEASAQRLVQYLNEPAAEIRDAARDALASLTVPHIDIDVADDGAVTLTPRYRTANGVPLLASPGALATEDGERYVLDAGGEPIREADAEWGGCRCCDRPRALIRRGQRRPECPNTGQSYLLDDDAPVLEADHPLGGCSQCESPHPLVRVGGAIFCGTCHVEYARDGERLVPRGQRRADAKTE
jgi:hypothetical protein